MELRPILSALLRNKTGPILVALQVALSLAILANALHIVNERRAVAARPSGLSNEAATFYLQVQDPDSRTPEQMLAAIKRDVGVLRSVPGVAAVAHVSQMPLSQSGWTNSFTLRPDPAEKGKSTAFYMSGDSLVKTFGLRLVEGRDFLPHEVVDFDETRDNRQPAVVIISKSLADKTWPGESAIGKTIYFGNDGADSTRVVGVFERLQSSHAQIGERGELSAIAPLRPYGEPGMLYALRADPGQRERVMKDAEQALRQAAATPIIIQARTVEQDRNSRYRADLGLAWMLVTVSVLLLMVTCSGIVGMASLWVNQRRKQIGVRRALGAKKRDIVRYFILENVLITSAGVFGGVLLGIGLNQLLVSRLEMERLPLGYLAGGAIMLWALGIAAAYGPAWRAAGISPALATRSA
jgi:putative ABC transport system permease protein